MVVEWNEQKLKKLIQKMGLEREKEQGNTPIHLSLYGTPHDPSPLLNDPSPLLTQIMCLDANKWAALGYEETDRVSVVRCLGSLGCRTDGAQLVAAYHQRPLTPELAKTLIDAGAFDETALWHAAMHQQPLPLELAKLLIDAGMFDEEVLSAAAEYQHPLPLELAKLLIDAGAFDEEALSAAAANQHPLPLELAKLLVNTGAFNEYALSAAACSQQSLTLELAKLLIDAGAFDEDALSEAARYQQPLTLELAKLLVDAGCDPAVQDDDGWDALVYLAVGGYSVDPQVTDLFLSCGCRTDLDGCHGVFNEQRLRFGQILKEHAEWKEKQDRLLTENSPTDTFYGPDWGR